MNEMIKVDFDTQTVSARELHKEVGSSERFSTWFERQLQFGFVENEDYTGCKTFNAQAHQELQDYNVSVDMAKQICMVQKNERARAVRQYLIDLEKAWNTPEQVFARALKMADKTIESLKVKNATLLADNQRMKPKEDFFDAVADSKDAIDIGNVSKMLNFPSIGRNKLFEILRDEKVLMKDNIPYQKYIDKGYFRTIEQKYTVPNGEIRISIKTLVYQKGVDFIRKLLIGYIDKRKRSA